MDNEMTFDVRENAGADAPASNSGSVSNLSNEQSTKAVLSTDKPNFTDHAKNRREKIKKLEARLEREIARDTAASRKERNGQLFVWGAMVEGMYRDGTAQERDQLRQWARRKLTDKRHLQRAENGFARIEDEAADMADA